MFICGQKFNFILHVFLKILQRYCKLVILGTLGIPGTHTQIVTNQFVETFRLFGGKKSTSSPMFFWRYCKDVIANLLFWVLWASLGTHTQNDSINLKSDSHLPKKFLFICFNESPLEMMKNAFYFILNALFVLKTFKFLS